MAATPKKPASAPPAAGRRKARRQGFLVLGMHRSGTSSVAGTLVKLGIAAPRTLMAGKDDNPRGHWESEALAAFHDELLASAGSRWDDWRAFHEGWYETPVASDFRERGRALLKQEFGNAPAFVLKDPRVCRLARFWLEIFAEEGIDAKILLPLRSPLEVAQSHRTRDGFSIRKGLLLWLRHVLDAEAASRNLPRGLFEWSDFLSDWRAVAGRLEKALDVRWPASTDLSARQVDGFLSRELKHEIVADRALEENPQLHSWVIEAYAALRDLARDPGSAGACAALDRLRERFDEAAGLFGGALADMEVACQELQASLQVERLAWTQAEAQHRREREQAVAAVHEAQGAAGALQADRDVRAQEVERLTALIDVMRANADQANAALRDEMRAALDIEREARAAEAEAHRAAVGALQAERDARAGEVERLSALVEDMRVNAEQATAALRDEMSAAFDIERQDMRVNAEGQQAALRRDFDATLRSAREERTIEAEKLASALRELESRHSTSTGEVARLGALLEAARTQLETTEQVVRQSAEVASVRDSELQRLSDILHAQRAEADKAQAAYLNSTSWRITKPVRLAKRTFDGIAGPIRGTLTLAQRVGGVRSAISLFRQKVVEIGPKAALTRAKLHIRRASEPIRSEYQAPHVEAPSEFDGAYREPVVASPHGENPINLRYRALLEDAQRRFSGDNGTSAGVQEQAGQSSERIAILMPVYKVPIEFLRRTIESVIRQTHANWELCIVDDFSQDKAIADLLQTYASLDGRIRIAMAGSNLGISGASNMALSMIESRYFCLLDHDDMLTCDALESFAQVLSRAPETDVIYSDECKIDENDTVQDVFIKPDWDPFLMHNSMYIGHLTLYRTGAVREVGGFRSDYDLSQDYDLALRVTEAYHNVVHVQKVLYGWRMIPQSAASGGKPHARITNIAALKDAMTRRGWKGAALALPTANRIVLDRAQMEQKVAIIIPSDNVEQIVASIDSVRRVTTYGRYELVVVTNSPDIAKVKRNVDRSIPVKYVPYDLPFNFSDKRNRGAEATDADIYVFFNDDVRVKTPDWIESLLDYVLIDGVGAVGPKLLYENDTIQHAGMVTGVRGLFGTAFHVLRGGSSVYFNFIQSVRQVSNLCGACLALRKDVYWKVGGFDAVDFPIAHSDGDLCFKVRAAGLACVYTPHAELHHIGHVSIGATKKAQHGKPRVKNKVDIRTLKKWPDFISYDPFFHPQLAGIAYHDSQQTYRMLPADLSMRGSGHTGQDILLVFHDLTNSGAPRVLFEAALGLIADGHFVVAVSPSDGPYAARLRAKGVFVIIDELALTGHPSVVNFARNFDRVLANTVIAWPLVAQCAGEVETYWYIHESKLVSELCSRHPEVAEAFRAPKAVWATCQRVRDAVAPYRPDVQINEIGLSLPSLGTARAPGGGLCVNIVVVGSIEAGKGQDLAIAAFELVRKRYTGDISLRIVGRTLDGHFASEIGRLAGKCEGVTVVGEVSPDDALAEIDRADILLIPSRDEPFSLVGVEAMALRTVVVLGPEVGLSSYLRNGETGFLARSSAPDDLADAIIQALQSRSSWPEIGRSARRTFDEFFTSQQLHLRLRNGLSLQPQEAHEDRPGSSGGGAAVSA